MEPSYLYCRIQSSATAKTATEKKTKKREENTRNEKNDIHLKLYVFFSGCVFVVFVVFRVMFMPSIRHVFNRINILCRPLAVVTYIVFVEHTKDKRCEFAGIALWKKLFVDFNETLERNERSRLGI